MTMDCQVTAAGGSASHGAGNDAAGAGPASANQREQTYSVDKRLHQASGWGAFARSFLSGWCDCARPDSGDIVVPLRCQPRNHPGME